MTRPLYSSHILKKAARAGRAARPGSRSLVDDIRTFVRPLVEQPSALRDALGKQSLDGSPFLQPCPLCWRYSNGTKKPAIPMTGAVLERHIHAGHALEAASQADFRPWNDDVLRRAVKHSLDTDVTVVVDLANVEMGSAIREWHLVPTNDALRDVFSRYSVTMLITHELLVPFTVKFPEVAAQLLRNNPESALFTQYAVDGLDSGDLLTGAAVQRFLSHPGANSKVVVITRDWLQHTSLQMLFDKWRLEVMVLPRVVKHWAEYFSTAFSRRY